MIQTIKKISLEIYKPNLFKVIAAKQGDSNSRFLKATIVDDAKKIDVPLTSTVTINAVRGDGVAKSFAGTVNDDGTVTVPLTSWMLDIDGVVECDVSVFGEENSKLTTSKFIVEVEDATCTDGNISEDENYDILVQLITDVKSLSVNKVIEITENASDEEVPTAKAVYDYGESIKRTANAPVQSVNGKTGAVNLTASDVHALPDTTTIPKVPENISAFNNDAGYLTDHQSLKNYPTKSEVEADFTVAKAEFVEALGKKQDALEKYVESVNGYSGKVVLSASDVKALPDTTVIPTVPNNVSEFVNDAGYLTEHQSLEEYAKKTETDEKIATHNVSDSSHQDIRLLITNLVNRLNALADSDDTTLDQLSEIVAYIKSNKNLIDAITTEKISYADIVNNLTTNVTNKPLSASMGVALKAAIDAIIIPTKVSQLENDSGFAKASDVDVKLGNKQEKLSEYVSTVNSKSGAVVLTYADVGALPSDTVIPTIPKNVSAFENDKSYVTSTELTTKLSGKQEKLTSYVETVNGKSGKVTLNASDVGALPSTTVIPPSYEPFYIDCTINQEGGVFSAIATSDTPKQEEVDAAFAQKRPIYLRWESAGIYIQCLARVYAEGFGSIYNFVTIVNEVTSTMQFMNGGFYNTYFVAQEKIAVVSSEDAVEEGKITIVV